MDLVGTVPLPGPFPSTAKIFVVRYPPAPGAKGDEAKPRFFVKLVETINSNHVITRIISPEYLRAIRWKPDAAAGAAEPPVESGDKVRADIAKIDWTKAVKDPRSSYEIPLKADHSGVVHVAESSPVLLRHEQTVPASVSHAVSPVMLAAPCARPRP